ncbi:hypothetical protein SPHINGOT1_620058 [Sphingomonas sp. T1]|nr:hypothetical protein SPHINGOT1_620058 [Sphingomonas sp. T1]
MNWYWRLDVNLQDPVGAVDTLQRLAPLAS